MTRDHQFEFMTNYFPSRLWIMSKMGHNQTLQTSLSFPTCITLCMSTKKSISDLMGPNVLLIHLHHLRQTANVTSHGLFSTATFYFPHFYKAYILCSHKCPGDRMSEALCIIDYYLFWSSDRFHARPNLLMLRFVVVMGQNVEKSSSHCI